MIIVTGNARIQPDTQDAARAALEPLIAATRAEDGCESYTFGFDVDDPELLLFTELWRDQAALDAHFATPHIAAFGAAMAEFVADGPAIAFYDATKQG